MKLIKAFSVAILLLSSAVQAEHADFRFRPLQRLRRAIHGTDLTIQFGGELASCQSTPVAKKDLGNDLCRMAYVTAAHCVDKRFRAIDIQGVGSISADKIQVSIPKEYFDRQRDLRRFRGGSSKEAHSGDSATLIFDIACDKVEEVEPLPLAKVGSDGVTVINTKNVYLQKRQEQTGGNRGEGAQIIANVVRSDDDRMFEFYSPSPQGYAIVGGDSGGPVFNERGELVCPISGSSYEAMRAEGRLRRPPNGPDSLLDPFTVSCDKRAIARTMEDLKKFGLSPVSSADGAAIAQDSSSVRPQADSSGAQPSHQGGAGGGSRPLLGGMDDLLGLNDSSHEGGNCEGGVCRPPARPIAPSQDGAAAAGAGAGAGDGAAPPASVPQAESTPTRGPGFKEVGPARREDLEKLFSDAKAKGYKHIIVRYGNDRTCFHCRNLKAELAREFGNMDDVMVIKVEGFEPIQGQGIPQSQLHSLDELGGFKQVGSTQVGSGKGQLFKKQVEDLKAQQARRTPSTPEKPRENTLTPQGHTPGSGGASAPRLSPQSGRPPSEPAQQSGRPPSEPAQQSGRPSNDPDLIAAPESPRNVFNGFKFEGNSNGELHFLKPGETPSRENAIYLKRFPDGTRKAVSKDKEGNTQELSEKIQDGLRQYYEANADKIPHLSEQQRGFVDAFLKGSQQQPPAQQQQQQQPQQPQPTGQPSADSPSGDRSAQQPAPQQPPHAQTPAGDRPAASDATNAQLAEAQKAIDQYENGMRYLVDAFENGRRIKKDLGPREHFPEGTFKDVPKGGTGQIILAYFGPKNQKLEEAGQAHPLIDVRNYPVGSPEHRHAQLFGVQALALDGLGRKISRYQSSPLEVFNSFASGQDQHKEVETLKKYLDAKKVIAAHGSAQSIPPSSQPPSQAPRPEEGNTPPSEKPEHPPVDEKGVAAILEGKCVRCHKAKSALDDNLKTTSGLLEHLKSATDGTLEDMAERAGISNDDLNKLKAFRDSHSHASAGSRSASTGHGSSGGGPAGGTPSRVGEGGRRELASASNLEACYMSDAERRSRIEALPQFETTGSPIASSVNAALSSGNAVFYDNRSVPVAWLESRMNGGRDGGSILSEQHHNNVNSYRQMGYHADGNREFPWKSPAGTDASGDTIASEKFFIPSASGKLASVVSRNRSNSPSYYGKASNVNGPDFGMDYERGATFGEVLKVKDPQTGEAIPFEVRLRRKNNDGIWQMDVLRPFENSSDLLAGLKKLCIESSNPPAGCARLSWSSLEQPNIQVFDRSQFVNKQNLGSRLDPLKLSSTAASALPEKAALQVLPELPPDVVRALLTTTPFKSVFGKPWNEAQAGASEGWAPTSNSNFNIVPKNYFGGFIAMNQVSCMKCHESAGRSVDNFDPVRDEAAGIVNDPSDARRARTWYNKIRGEDGILSFHPFDARQVANRGIASRQAIQDCLKRSGLVQ